MKEASWKVLVQTYLKAFFLFFVVIVVLFVLSLLSLGRWVRASSHISLLSCTERRGFRAFSHLMKPQVGWEGKCWAGCKTDPRTSQFHMCWARLSVAQTLPLASSKVSDMVSRYAWLPSRCHRCPSGGRSRFLVFSSSPCFMGKNGCCHLALRGWGRAVQPFQIQKTDVCWDSRRSGLHACCWFTVTQCKA